MNKIINSIIFKIWIIISLIIIPNFNNAKEILIYADNISYDEDEMMSNEVERKNEN